MTNFRCSAKCLCHSVYTHSQHLIADNLLDYVHKSQHTVIIAVNKVKGHALNGLTILGVPCGGWGRFWVLAASGWSALVIQRQLCEMLVWRCGGVFEDTDSSPFTMVLGTDLAISQLLAPYLLTSSTLFCSAVFSFVFWSIAYSWRIFNAFPRGQVLILLHFLLDPFRYENHYNSWYFLVSSPVMKSIVIRHNHVIHSATHSVAQCYLSGNGMQEEDIGGFFFKTLNILQIASDNVCFSLSTGNGLPLACNPLGPRAVGHRSFSLVSVFLNVQHFPFQQTSCYVSRLSQTNPHLVDL